MNAPISRSEAMLRETLLSKATATLQQNDTGRFIKPGPRQYPHQWNWDTPFVAIGLAHVDAPRARDEIRALLLGQWRDGFLPHVIYHGGASDYFPNPEFWQTERSPQAPPISTSGITQPPLLATAVRHIHALSGDDSTSIDFLREVYPSLLGWHRWLYSARDPEGSGLVAIIHPWESGTDNSTRWTEPMQRITPHDLPAYARRDAVHVIAGERPQAADYERYIYLIDRFRRARYDPQDLFATSPFLVQDVLFNALLHRANEDLRWLAAQLNEPAAEIETWLSRTRDAFRQSLWHEQAGLYYDYDLRAGTPIRENSCATFIPLFAGIPDEHTAQRLVEEQLRNPLAYAPGPHARYYLTSTAISSPDWEPRRYWRGPVWVPINWLLIHGLRRYGYSDLAAKIRRQTLDLVAQNGFHEYYDPRDGSGCGSPDFSWTAALTIDLLLE